MDPTTVVMQLLDNSCYFGRAQDGSKTAPKRGEDNAYHLEGEVTVCSGEIQLEHYNMIKPLLHEQEEVYPNHTATQR
jgi:hypothetical protein